MFVLRDAGLILGLCAVATASGLSVVVVPALWIALTTPLLVRTDLAERRLPNAGTLPGLVLLAGCLALRAAENPQEALVASIVSLTIAALGFAAALTPGFGMGDAKLLALLAGSAALVDVAVLPLFALTSALAGAAAALLVVRTARRATPQVGGQAATTVPFGPCLLLGYWSALTAAVL